MSSPRLDLAATEARRGTSLGGSDGASMPRCASHSCAGRCRRHFRCPYGTADLPGLALSPELQQIGAEVHVDLCGVVQLPELQLSLELGTTVTALACRSSTVSLPTCHAWKTNFRHWQTVVAGRPRRSGRSACRSGPWATDSRVLRGDGAVSPTRLAAVHASPK